MAFPVVLVAERKIGETWQAAARRSFVVMVGGRWVLRGCWS